MLGLVFGIHAPRQAPHARSRHAAVLSLLVVAPWTPSLFSSAAFSRLRQPGSGGILVPRSKDQAAQSAGPSPPSRFTQCWRRAVYSLDTAVWAPGPHTHRHRSAGGCPGCEVRAVPCRAYLRSRSSPVVASAWAMPSASLRPPGVPGPSLLPAFLWTCSSRACFSSGFSDLTSHLFIK